ncbi:MAG: GNAT family N-acetyltransferase [Myxococcota bacterium]
MSLLRGLRFRWDLLTGRYRAAFVRTAAERDACSQILRQVRGSELGRGGCSFDQVPLHQAGTEVRDVLVACFEGDRIVGAARATRVDEVIRNPSTQSDFQFDLPKLNPVAHRTFLAHRLVMLPEHRGTGASFVLIQTLYDEGLRRGIVCSVLDCEPPLLRLYARLGYRPLAAPYSADGVVFVPLVMIHHDAQELKRVGSPLLARWRSAGRPIEEAGAQWWERYAAENNPPTPGFTRLRDNEDLDMPLLEGVSASGCQALLRNAHRVPLTPGQQVIAQGDKADWLAVVEEGLVEVRIDGQRCRLLSRGDLFGELSFVLGQGRTADVIAGLGGATAIMLSPSAVRRLSDPQDQVAVWRNLATIMARRFAEL